MTQPTLVAYSESVWTDTGTAANATASFTWVNGDIMYVLGGTCDTGVTFATPTTAGSNMGTFSLVTSVTASSSARAYYWKATATGSGNGTITASCTGGGGGAANVGGISVWQYRDVSGEGTPVTLNASASKTMSITRATANCHVLQVMVDWNEVNDIVTDPTPATNATERETSAVSGQADFFVTEWGDQGATGTTSYGITNHTGTVKISGIALEIKGVASGAMSGVVALTLTPSGAMTGAGALSGAVALSLAPVGALTGAGALAGAIALSLTPSGALTGSGAMAGAIALSLTPIGVMSGAGAIAGAVSMSLTPSGVLTGAGALAGAVPLSITPIGALTGTGALVGNTALTITVDGTLANSASGAVTGSIPMAFAITSTLTGSGAMLGAIDMALDLTGAFDAAAPTVQESFSGGFFDAFEREQFRRAAKRRRKLEEEDELRAIQDATDREIAQLLRVQEARDAERDDLAQLKRLTENVAREAQQAFTERTAMAYAKALAQQNTAALLAFERAVRQQIDEEDMTALLFLLNR